MRGSARAAISLIAIGGLVSASARASDIPAPNDQCVPVNASIVTTFFLEGCTSPFGLCTEGVIDFGPLAGTTQFSVLTLEPGVSPEILLYTGELAITMSQGVLTLQDRGALNALDGSFFEIEEVVSGTDAVKGVTGTLFAQGISTPTGFEGTISGQVCGLPAVDPILD